MRARLAAAKEERKEALCELDVLSSGVAEAESTVRGFKERENGAAMELAKVTDEREGLENDLGKVSFRHRLRFIRKRFFLTGV